MDAVELQAAIGAREVSPVEIVEQSLAALGAVESRLNSFVTPTPELALAAARAAEDAVMAGVDGGSLRGIPVSVKDLIAVADVRMTMGSRTLADNVASADAPVVERLRAAGAAIVGKTTTSEFGCKATGDSPLTGITRNPWDLALTPGGSSCGAAASVAAGVTPFALGTDGGGSVRIPAALTGLVGVKAQFGRVPVFPTSATPSLAHVGVLARTVRDAALLLGAVSGHDPRDPYSVAGPVPDYMSACDEPVRGMRVVWSPTLGYAEPSPEVVEITSSVLDVLEGLGCEVEVVDSVFGTDPVDLWVAEFYAGVGTRLNKALRETPELLDPMVVDILSRALDQTTEEYYTSVFNRFDLRERVRSFFERCDILMTPTLPVPAFPVGLGVPDGYEHRNIVSWVYYTYPFNLTGQPAASVPAGWTKGGLPVGVQLVAKTNQEVDVFRLAAALELTRPWADRRPAVWAW